ncbi:hypothetical protein CRE_23113 [Caenorhabditis remanei]|uniref:Uncharacterized protein n=1 Tax=Caenorhabditis remanei TaxID=31234 RepID=E3ND29_CAERE|nr:hypothetical protein CRE_23113 [Caenorhabditis remanei]
MTSPRMGSLRISIALILKEEEITVTPLFDRQLFHIFYFILYFILIKYLIQTTVLFCFEEIASFSILFFEDLGTLKGDEYIRPSPIISSRFASKCFKQDFRKKTDITHSCGTLDECGSNIDAISY